MDWLTFFATVIGDVVYPATALFILFFLLKNLSRIVKAVKRLKFKDFELELRDEVAELSSEAREANVTIMYPVGDKAPSTDDLNLQFLQIWIEIERLLRESASAYLVDGKMRGASQLISVLEKNDIVTLEIGDLLRRLARIRNAIVHAADAPVSRTEMFEVLGVARSVRSRLEQRLKRLE